MTEAVVLAKRGYVGMMRLVRRGARPLGLLERTPSFRNNRLGHWLQSLLAIYDVDALIGLDVPWWTYEAIARVEDFLKGRDRPVVFEYGSGASTVWLAKRAHKVVSVEHDSSWIEILKPRLSVLDNVDLELVPPDPELDPDPRFRSRKPGYRDRSFRDYVEAIGRRQDRYDVIVIDGRARPGCLMQAIGHLADDGLIVFDNSHRRHYRDAIESCGLDRSVTRGLVPSLPVPDETSLLRRAGSASGK